MEREFKDFKREAQMNVPLAQKVLDGLKEEVFVATYGITKAEGRAIIQEVKQAVPKDRPHVGRGRYY